MDLGDKETDFESVFSNMALRLSMEFPELDLRFSKTENSSTARLMVAEKQEEFVELDLNQSLERCIWEAIFSVKELMHRFDA